MEYEGRYSRNIPALTAEECALLREKRVCVVGCGGLGGFIIEHLARVGVGALTVIDGDVFDTSNLNRQLLCLEEFIGCKKAEIAAQRVSQINSGVAVTAVTEMLTQDNAASLLSGCDLVLDALDSTASRLALAQACDYAGLTLVHGAISGWFAQVSVVAPGSGTMERLYAQGSSDKMPSRGNLGFAASICASIQAAEAVKLLCNRESALLGKLLVMDFKSMEFTKLDF